MTRGFNYAIWSASEIQTLKGNCVCFYNYERNYVCLYTYESYQSVLNRSTMCMTVLISLLFYFKIYTNTYTERTKNLRIYILLLINT